MDPKVILGTIGVVKHSTKCTPEVIFGIFDCPTLNKMDPKSDSGDFFERGTLREMDPKSGFGDFFERETLRKMNPKSDSGDFFSVKH